MGTLEENGKIGQKWVNKKKKLKSDSNLMGHILEIKIL